AAQPLAYGAGFVLATGLLHVTGIAIGLMQQWRHGERVLRLAGVGIAIAGSYLLMGLVRA
ncbi:MAG: HupE/UreJ family protein, partial [Bryobacteraceae bacterium]